jgi:hypothetical protein
VVFRGGSLKFAAATRTLSQTWTCARGYTDRDHCAIHLATLSCRAPRVSRASVPINPQCRFAGFPNQIVGFTDCLPVMSTGINMGGRSDRIVDTSNRAGLDD